MAVVVVHERKLDDVKAWPFLKRCISGAQGVALQSGYKEFFLDRVLIYDNSSLGIARPDVPIAGCDYVHNERNGGTAAAYTQACALALELGISWLLLLDQDSLLPQTFLESATACFAASTPKPAALVPWVLHGESVVSPARISYAGTVLPLPYRSTPIEAEQLTAISSGSLIHVPTLASCMPLPDGLWLDYVDHWLFAQLRTLKHPVGVFDATLQHNLSVFSVRSLSNNRLTHILNGEAIFFATLGPQARFVYPFRLAVRMLRYARVRPDLALQILSWFFRNLQHRA